MGSTISNKGEEENKQIKQSRRNKQMEIFYQAVS
jgi:hypothetical protein